VLLGVSRAELTNLWSSSDNDELKAILQSAFSSSQLVPYALSGNSDKELKEFGGLMASTKIRERLKELRLKHDINSRRRMIQASKEIILNKNKGKIDGKSSSEGEM